jgi:hypothetical protein
MLVGHWPVIQEAQKQQALPYLQRPMKCTTKDRKKKKENTQKVTTDGKTKTKK